MNRPRGSWTWVGRVVKVLEGSLFCRVFCHCCFSLVVCMYCCSLLCPPCISFMYITLYNGAWTCILVNWTWSWTPMYTRLLFWNVILCAFVYMWRVSQFGLHTISHITGMLPDSFFAKDPSNQKWSFIDCKTASRTSCFSLGLCADPTPQSHCALPLLLPVNQSEPSVFVMVEDNQFQNKEKKW